MPNYIVDVTTRLTEESYHTIEVEADDGHTGLDAAVEAALDNEGSIWYDEFEVTGYSLLDEEDEDA